MLQIPTCLPPRSAGSRKQEQGPNRSRDAGSWEGKERGEMHSTSERLLRFERMTDKPQYSSDLFVQENVGEHNKGLNPFMEEPQQGQNSPASLSE